MSVAQPPQGDDGAPAHAISATLTVHSSVSVSETGNVVTCSCGKVLPLAEWMVHVRESATLS